jgi:hypothetical protein
LLLITDSRIKIKQAIRGHPIDTWAATEWRPKMRSLFREYLPVAQSVAIGIAAFCFTVIAMLGHGALIGAGPFA